MQVPWWRKWSRQITIDEIGGGVRTLNARTADDLCGVEYRMLEGSVGYVRLAPSARAPGATFVLREH